jgi:hypothetical protein
MTVKYSGLTFKSRGEAAKAAPPGHCAATIAPRHGTSGPNHCYPASAIFEIIERFQDQG